MSGSNQDKPLTDIDQDKLLADRVVALGVGEYTPSVSAVPYQIEGDDTTLEAFVHDWRVAGALMEKLRRKQGWMRWASGRHLDDGHDVVSVQAYLPASSVSDGQIVADDLCHAIIEACVEALERV